MLITIILGFLAIILSVGEYCSLKEADKKHGNKQLANKGIYFCFTLSLIVGSIVGYRINGLSSMISAGLIIVIKTLFLDSICDLSTH